jgi:hypothetical protein
MSDPLDFSSSDEDEKKEEEEPFQQQRHQINKQKGSNKSSSETTNLDNTKSSVQTPIQNRYVFWFMHRSSHKGGGTASSDSFEQALIPVASFQVL